MTLWALVWRTNKNHDEHPPEFIWNAGLPVLFITRKSAREYVDSRYGYIRHREDLRNAPHGWRLPMPVRVRIVAE